jgi:hypothetical protein
VLVERLHVQCRQPPKFCSVLGGVNTSYEPLALPIRHLARLRSSSARMASMHSSEVGECPSRESHRRIGDMLT